MKRSLPHGLRVKIQLLIELYSLNYILIKFDSSSISSSDRVTEPVIMALRDMSAGGEMPTHGGASAVSGLPAFWDSADTAPKTE